jgi:hypothetical protein
MLRILATALALGALVATAAFAGDPTCVPASACPGMSDANAAYHYLEQQRAQEHQRQLNSQNGTSQYTGPTVGFSHGTPTSGYQWSTR